MTAAEFFAKLERYAGEEAAGAGRLRLLLTMTGRALRSAARVRSFDRPAIVIGGCGRSGTTLLLSVLSAHPGICAIPVETLALCPTGYDDSPDLAAPLRLARIYRLLLLQEIAPGCRRWCEKTPRNVLFFGRILDRFGDRVRILNIVRDGRDVVTSRHPTEPGRYWVTPERWLADVAAGRRHEDDDRVLTVRYEDLVGSFESTARTICGFLGEACDERLLAWHEHATVRTNVAWAGSVRPLHRDSVARWRRPEHQAVVRQLLGSAEAADLLRHYRYLDAGTGGTPDPGTPDPG